MNCLYANWNGSSTQFKKPRVKRLSDDTNTDMIDFSLQMLIIVLNGPLLGQ